MCVCVCVCKCILKRNIQGNQKQRAELSSNDMKLDKHYLLGDSSCHVFIIIIIIIIIIIKVLY